ncbi:MAG: hypothetical protein ISR78_07800, partial [Spirochaetia bacterium]|nr:hypothetical protein [Spirochaetia bacterium]
GGPYPCVSLYKPFIISPDSFSEFKKFSDTNKQALYAEDHAQLYKRILEAPEYKRIQIQKRALEYEEIFREMVYEELGTLPPAALAEKCRTCFLLEKKYEKEVEIVLKDDNPHFM